MNFEKEENPNQRLISSENKDRSITPDPPRKFTCHQRLVLLLLTFGDFTCFCSLGILAPLFPAEASRKGMSIAVSGFVFGIYALIIFFVSPLMSVFAGRIDPKVLFMQGLGIVGFSNILFGISSHVDSMAFTLFTLLVRSMTALGAAAHTAACYMIIADIFPNDIETALTFIKVGVSFGVTLGPGIGGVIFDWAGFGPPFFILGGVVLLVIPLSLLLLPQCNSENDVLEKQSFLSLWKLFKSQPAIILISIVVIVVSSSSSFLEPILEPHLRTFNLSATQVGLFFMLPSGVFSLSSPLFGFVAVKRTRTWMMVIGLILTTISLLLIGPSVFAGLENTILVNLICLGLLGISVSMSLLPTFEALLDFAIEAGWKDELATYGLVGGLWASMYSLGEVIGPALGAFLMDNIGFPFCTLIFAIISLICAIGMIIYVDMKRRDKNKIAIAMDTKESSIPRPRLERANTR